MNNLAKKVKNSGTGKMMHGTEKVVHTVESVNISFTQRKAFTYDSPATFYQKSWKSPLFQSIHL